MGLDDRPKPARATVNPYRVPLEPDYGDNTSQANVSFLPSPRLSVEFFRLAYELGGTIYAPRLREDVLATYSWLLRAYPIGGALGENFRPHLWYVAAVSNWAPGCRTAIVTAIRMKSATRTADSAPPSTPTAGWKTSATMGGSPTPPASTTA